MLAFSPLQHVYAFCMTVRIVTILPTALHTLLLMEHSLYLLQVGYLLHGRITNTLLCDLKEMWRTDSIYLSTYLSVCLSACLPACLSIYLSILIIVAHTWSTGHS
jgi:hypothetical protein